MNIPINPISVYVLKSFLYDNVFNIDSVVKAEIIAISTYLDQTITFTLLIDKQWIYSDLPITSFYHKKIEDDLYNLQDLSYSNCKTLEIDKFELNNIEKKICVFFPSKKVWKEGEYLMSFDFYTGNDLLHFIKLNNGNFCLAPNHKINWNNVNDLAVYNKNKNIWKI